MRSYLTVGVLTTFAVLAAELAKAQENEIPTLDLQVGALLVLSSALVALTGKRDRSRPFWLLTDRPKEFNKALTTVMNLEITFMLAIPWMLLKGAPMIQKTFGILPEYENLVAYLLAPHLFFFQAQIVGESILSASDNRSLSFPYTCVANAYRGRPIWTWMMRSLTVMHEIHPHNPLHVFLVLILPVIGVALWGYSSFVFMPMWYRVLQANASASKEP